MHAAVIGHRLGGRRAGEADDAHASRARLIALDESLLRERRKQVGDRLRRLDAKLLRDLADAGLIRVLREEVDQVVVYPSFQRRQRLRHGPSPARATTGRKWCSSPFTVVVWLMYNSKRKAQRLSVPLEPRKVRSRAEIGDRIIYAPERALAPEHE